MNSSNSEQVTMNSDEMIERCTSWTLGCDNALLNRLRSISENLEHNAQEVSSNFESLSRDVSILQAKLFCVTNQFLMVSNSQFVENRVQDFEEESSNSQLPVNVTGTGSLSKVHSTTKAEKEAHLIAKMKEAIQIGVSTQEDHLNSLTQHQNPYSSSLSLPHLIGSSKFFSSRYVGLTDENSRIFNRTVDNPVAVSSSNIPKVNQISSLQPVTADLEPNQILVSISSKSDVMDDLKFPYSNSILPNTISEQPVRDSSVIIPTASTGKSQSSIQSTKEDLSRFENAVGPPPPRYADISDESDDDFKPAATDGRRLFVDDDDDLFNDSSLFVSKPDESLFFGIKNTIAHQNLPSTLIEPPPYQGLKDKSRTSSVEEGSAVGSLPESDNISAPSPLPVQPKDSHFPYGREIETNNNPIDRTPRSKIPPGGVSVFGKVPPEEVSRLQSQQSSQSKKADTDEKGSDPSIIVRAKNLNTSERGSSIQVNEDHDAPSHSSQATKGRTSPSQGSLNEPNGLSNRFNKTVHGIFDDDSDEDIFFSNKRQTVGKNIKENAGLFDNLTSNKRLLTADLPTKNVSKFKSKLKGSIFDDSDSEDDLFSSANSIASSKTSSKIQSSLFTQPSTSSFNGNQKNLNQDMFRDDSNANLFANVNSVDSKSSKTNDHTVNMNQERSTTQSNEKTTMGTEDTISTADTVSDEEFNQKSDNTDSQPKVIDSASHLHKDSEFTGDKDANSDIEGQPQNLSAMKDSESVLSASNIDKSLIETNSEIFLQSAIDKEKEPLNSTNAISPKTVNPKIMGKNEVSESKNKTPVNKIVNSKTPEYESNILKTEAKAKPPVSIKTKISVKALALGLNINPLAMRPGAKAIKQNSVEKSDSVVSSGTESPSGAATPESPIKNLTLEEIISNSISRSSPEKILPIRSSPEKMPPSRSSSEEMQPSQLLPNLSKGRARIQFKRRLPSKQLLKSYSNSSMQEEINNEDESKQNNHSPDKSVVAEEEPNLVQALDLQSNSSPNIVPEVISPSTEEEDIFQILDSESNDKPFEVKKSEKSEIHQPVLNDQAELLDNKSEPSSNKTAAASTSKKNNSLWDNSDSDDLFIISSEKAEESKIIVENNDDDLFSSVPDTKLKNHAKNGFDSTSTSPKNELNSKTSSDDHKHDSETVSSKRTAAESSSKKIGKNKASKLETSSETKPTLSNDKPQGKSLFSDDEDDSNSLFRVSEVPKTATAISSSIQKEENKIDDISAVQPIKAASSTRKFQKGLFDSDSGDSDDLFHSSSKPKVIAVPIGIDLTKAVVNSSNTKPKKAVLKKGRKKPAATKSIFNDSSDDDLFASSKSADKKSAVA